MNAVISFIGRPAGVAQFTFNLHYMIPVHQPNLNWDAYVCSAPLLTATHPTALLPFWSRPMEECRLCFYFL
jgi:hypothetical protein